MRLRVVRGGVFNDAQIASIKQRLNLTPEQEKLWPAVEAALRKIVYTKNAMSPRVPAAQPGGERMAYIDPTSADVQQLKYAALPPTAADWPAIIFDMATSSATISSSLLRVASTSPCCCSVKASALAMLPFSVAI